jgi:hypothetical protein
MCSNVWRFLSTHAMRRAGVICGLSAFLIVLLFTGCAHEQAAPETENVKDLAHKVISDPARADKVAALMEQLDAEINAQMKRNSDAQKAFSRLNADYDATPEQFQQLIEDAQKTQTDSRGRMMELYFQIKANTSAQEWDALCKPEMQKLTSYLKILEESSKK